MSYGCHPAFFYLRSELISKTRRRVRKIIATAIGTECILYILISVAGYISLGGNLVPGIFTLRKSLRTCEFISLIFSWTQRLFHESHAMGLCLRDSAPRASEHVRDQRLGLHHLQAKAQQVKPHPVLDWHHILRVPDSCIEA